MGWRLWNNTTCVGVKEEEDFAQHIITTFYSWQRAQTETDKRESVDKSVADM